MTSALILIAAAGAQEPRVSLDLPILPIRKVLSELEKVSGQSYRLSGPDPDQSIFVQVKDLPLSRLREAIADVTQGRWVQSGTLFTLETVSEVWLRDKGFRESVPGALSKLVPAEAISASDVAKLQKEAEILTNAEHVDVSKMRKLEEFRRISPSGRLITRLAKELPIAELTSMRDRERKVFSLDPTALQKSLGPRARSSWEDYKAEVAVFREKAKLMPEPDPGKPRYWNPLVDPYKYDTEEGSTDKFLLSVKREGLTLSASLSIYHTSGYLASSDSLSLSGSVSFSPSTADSPKSLLDDLAGMSELVEVHPDDKVFYDDLAKIRGSSGRKALETADSTRDRLANMDKVDPLLFGPTRLMKQVANAQNKSLVAKVTDFSFLISALGAKPGDVPKLGLALQYTLGHMGPPQEGIKIDDELITLRPPNVSIFPVPSYMNRVATANFLRAAWKGDDLFEPMALLCSVNNSYTDVQIPFMLATLFGRTMELNYDQEGFDLLKLYGLLNQSERQQARSTEVRFSLAGLPANLNGHVQRMLLWSDRGIAPPQPPMASRPDQAEFVEDSSDSNYDSREFKYEPSVALVNALLAQSYVTIALKAKPKLYLESGSSDDDSRLEPASVGNVAWRLFDAEINPGRSYGKVLGFVNAEERSLSASFQIAPVGVQRRVFSVPNTKGAKRLKFEELPEEFRSKVAQMRTMYKEGHRGTGSSGGPIKPP